MRELVCICRSLDFIEHIIMRIISIRRVIFLNVGSNIHKFTRHRLKIQTALSEF